MITIDLHGLTDDEAVEQLMTRINHLLKHGQRHRINVIHGYGSSGAGGRLKSVIRETLDRCQVEYFCGEVFDGNPGHTIVLLSAQGPQQKQQKKAKRK